MDYTYKLLNIVWNEVPEEVRRQTKRCIRDVIATAAGATLLPDASRACRFVKKQFGDGEIPLWFQKSKSCMAGGAFYNSFLVDLLDYHDGFRPCKGHAGATVVPVVIAACTGRKVVGEELLTAVLMGYEIACRAGLAVHGLYEPAYHSSGSWACIGAAAAGARIYKFKQEQIDKIAGIAEYYAPMSPMIRCTSHPCALKDGAAGGALAAAVALEMFNSGFNGLPSILTFEEKGRQSISSLNNEWLILKQYFKPYPTCRWTHPALEAAVHLQKEFGFTYDEIDKIEVYTFAEAMSLMKFPPRTTHEAQYSLPWSVAAALVDSDLGIKQVHPDKLKDSTIINLGRRISASYDPSLQKVFPEKCLQRVQIVLKSGKVLESPAIAASGDYDKPISDERLNEKFIENLSGAIGRQKSAELFSLTENLEKYNVDDLVSYIL